MARLQILYSSQMRRAKQLEGLLDDERATARAEIDGLSARLAGKENDLRTVMTVSIRHSLHANPDYCPWAPPRCTTVSYPP